MTVCLPAIELVNIDAMASVDNVPAVSTALIKLIMIMIYFAKTTTRCQLARRA
jgi:hypothetical protein